MYRYDQAPATNSAALIERPLDAIDDVERIQSAAIAQQALAELAAQPATPDKLPSVTMLTTNEQVQDRQINMVDARSSDEPHLTLFMKLDNWSDLYRKSDDGEPDKKYWFESANGDRSRSISDLQSRSVDLTESKAELIHSERSFSVQGLVEVRIPCDDKTTEEIADTVTQTMVELTGQSLWDACITDESFGAWKTNTYRTYHKLGEGPLSPAQQDAANKLEITRTARDHIALTSPGQHDGLELGYKPGQNLRLRHEVKRVDDAIDAIVSGGLLSAMQRLETGSTKYGRSSAADIMTGGGDVVYAHAMAENETREVYTHDRTPNLVLKQSVLDRLDVRAYNTDAYGSKETTTHNVVQQAIGAQALRFIGTGYSDRLEPTQFSDMRGVHEVCIAGGVGTDELDSLVIFDDESVTSFDDTDWAAVLNQHIDYDHPLGAGTSMDRLKSQIQAAWTEPSAAKAALETIGINAERIEQITAGMNLPPRERIIAKLKQRGVHEVGGKSVEEFVVAGDVFVRQQ